MKLTALIMAAAMSVAVVASSLNVTASATGVVAPIHEEAAEHIGVMETTYSDGSWTSEYQTWYYNNFESGNTYFLYWAPWCVMFVDYIIDDCGGEVNVHYPKTASSGAMLQWYANKGMYAVKENYTPKPGDIIFFCYSSDRAATDHVGIVESVCNGVVTTIEGNTQGYGDSRYGVRRFTYALNDWRIKGYANTSSFMQSSSSASAPSAEAASIVSGASYNIVCKNGYYLNLYESGWYGDGARLCLWQQDWTTSQIMIPRQQADGNWLIYPKLSNNGNGRVLDVLRKNGQLRSGCSIDIWSPNDGPAQSLQLVPCGDGYYKLRLASNGLVIKAVGAYNNASLILTYDDGSAGTMFKFVRV